VGVLLSRGQLGDVTRGTRVTIAADHDAELLGVQPHQVPHCGVRGRTRTPEIGLALQERLEAIRPLSNDDRGQF